MKIDDGTTIRYVAIDVIQGTIGIDGIGSFTFNNYFGSNGLTSHSGIIKNIVAVFTPYYALFGNTSNTWTDNGDDDPYKPAWRFWGSEYTEGCQLMPDLSYAYCEWDNYYMFGIRVRHKLRSQPVPC